MKIGIEIHQRICNNKLFCDCNAVMTEEPIGTFTRYLHPVPGEQGLIDRAALFEASKKQLFKYDFFKGESCLVETDSEPPHEVNNEALVVALSVAKSLKMFVPDELHVMRKTVIDGSNTSGFQRTMVIGLGTNDSVIKTSEGVVKIKDLELEEESARITSRGIDESRFRINGLGIPLIEIGTEPDIKSGNQALEVAAYLGELLRLTGHAQRGIGSIRQDVNISVKGGARVEVKGFQELKGLPKLIDLEAQRQNSLIKIAGEVPRFKLSYVDVSNVFEASRSHIVRNKPLVLGLAVPGMTGLFKRKINELKTLGSEIADYARAYGVKGLIHSDENLKGYDLEEDFFKMRRFLNASVNDLLIIIAGDNLLVNESMKAVTDRINRLCRGVPEETRIANPDGTSSYARPLPGGDRMYPETDVPVISVTKKFLSSVPLPDSKDDRVKKLSSLGLYPELVNQLVLSPNLGLFYSLVKVFPKLNPVFIAKVLVEVPKEIKRRFNKDVSVLTDNHFTETLNLVNANQISEDAVLPLLNKLCASPSLKPDDLAVSYKKLSDSELESIVVKLINNYPEANAKVLMGLVMKEVGGRVNGRVVSGLIDKFLKTTGKAL